VVGDVVGQVRDVLGAIHVIEVVGLGRLIGVVHERVEEFYGGLAGSFWVIARDHDEGVVTAHIKGFILISKLMRSVPTFGSSLAIPSG